MSSLIKLFITRPTATILLTVAIVLSGLICYNSLPVADLPNVDFPVIMIRATQPGGSPEEIASTIAAPLERHLSQIADVTEMTSESTQNSVRIILQFSLERDINGAARDVEAAIQAARADLPSSLRQNPSYFKANPSGAPIMVLALTSDTLPMPKLYDYASNVLVQRLSTIKGVGQVEIGGSSLPSVRIEMNPLPLFRRGIGFEDVRAALTSANAHTPKGFIDDGSKRYQLDTNDQAEQADAYRDLIIAYRNGAPVKLSDIAEVKDSVEDLRVAGFFSKKPSVLAIVFPQAGANIIETINSIKKQLPYLEVSMPNDMQLHLAIDRSLTIRASVQDTQTTLIISIILVIIVVLVFLRKIRSTIIPAIVVPSSIIGTFSVMYLLDYSINNLSLMALTISTGFVVDDAIVVFENIVRYIEQGYSPREAALKGAHEVAFTVFSITASLIAVFVPILLLGGIAGRLFHEFAIILSITLIISMILSLTLTPMMGAMILEAEIKEPAHSQKSWWERLSSWIERLLNSMFEGYRHSLNWALNHKKTVILSLPATIGLMVYLFIVMPKGFFPVEDTGLMIGRLMGDQSTSFQEMRKKLLITQEAILQDKDVKSVAAFTGERAINHGSLFLQLADKNKRTDTTEDLIARVNNRLRHMVGAKFYMFSPGAIRAGGRQSNASYQYTLQSDNATDLYEWMPQLMAALRSHPELTDVSSDIEQGAPALRIDINRDMAARFQITPQLISNTLYGSFGQRSASIIYKPLNQYRVIMEVDPRYTQTPDILYQTWVSTAGGTAKGGTASNTIRVPSPTTSTSEQISDQDFRNQVTNSLAGGKNASTGSAVSTRSETLVPLSVVATPTPDLMPLSVNHQGQTVAATISFNLAKGASLSDAVKIVDEEQVKTHLPSTIHGTFAGNAAQYQQAINNEPILILAALAAVYIILGILYESYIHPLTILSTLPSAGVGALLALQIFGEEFSLIALIGVILLIGVVKKNAIMLVDFAIHAERSQNIPPLEAIHQAALLRFRPIMMTTFAAALGAVPLVFGNGYGAELRHPLGIAIIGGLIVSQALTLYTTPIVYLYLDSYSKWQRKTFKRIFSRIFRPHQDA
ncbi:efflux RND transporter permease subunit [Entomobacter blattae]|uniref:Multidrug resistance protein MdtC n=1 Tax=Entomobacter blattae TaxID=2762277 RepID=A0A7H1NND7_9PROT|nr:efflux RND transporter permease subunit [Entomobacter blattae]QNT77297.1 Multidrug resistance protein MdtC [Entomobacter blattae]